MARNRGGGGRSAGGGGFFGGGARKQAAPAPRKPAAATPPPPAASQAKRNPPPPAQASAPPPATAQQPRSGGMLSGLGGMMMQGMALGAGSSVGHAAVDGVMNKFSGSDNAPMQEAQAPQLNQAPQSVNNVPEGGVCSLSQKDLYQCLAENANSVAACQYFIDALGECQENSKQWA